MNFIHCDNLSCYEGAIKGMQQNNNTYLFLDLRTYAISRFYQVNEIFQLHSYADKMPQITQWQFVDLIGDVFRVMFEPVLALVENINSAMISLVLKVNGYVSVNVWSRYLCTKNFEKYELGGGLKLEKN